MIELARRYHDALEEELDDMPNKSPMELFISLYRTGRGREISKSKPLTEINDKYAKYQSIKNMAKDFTSGVLKDDPTELLLDTLVNWEEIEQEIFDTNMISHALKLDLYRKEGGDFVLTDRGREVTLERQRMTPVEARALIRETMRTQASGLTIETEEERTPTKQNPVSQL